MNYLSMDNSHANADRLSAALAAINSEDVLAQNEGVDLTIQLGRDAVSPLLALLEKGGSNREQVVFALSQIGDARAAEAFRAGLRDPNDRVRAYAAQGLARIGDPQATAAALQTLDDAADELHLDITPSVQTLGEMGLKVLPSLLDLLMDEDEMTRLHAQRAFDLILARRHGFVPGIGFPSPEAAERMRDEWRANGDYDYSAPARDRAVSVEKWRQWLKQVEE
jgi:HEAT repeat protein